MTHVSSLKIKFSSIRFKFFLIAALVSLIGFGVAIYFSTQWMAEEIRDDHKEKAGLIWTHIIHDLENAMLRINHEEIFNTLDIYKNYKDVQEVRVFNSKGLEVFSQERGRPEPSVEEAIQKGKILQYEKGINDERVTTFIVPIKNKPTCHRCHSEGETIRGALLLSLNHRGMEEYIGEQRQKFILLFTLLTLSIALTVAFAIHRLLLRPLKLIQKGTEAIARGDFSQRIRVQSSDEVAHLARRFNEMAETIESLFKRINEKRQELEVQYDLISRSRREWQETFDCITDPIVVMSKDCTIHQANKAFRKMFEAQMESFDGLQKKRDRNCRNVFGTCFLSQCPHKRVMNEKTPIIHEVEYPHLNTIFEVSVFPYFRSEDQFEGSIIILKDVTQKKEQERRAILRERLSSIGQTVSSVAHEINNPLATIGVSVEGLLKRVRDGRFDPVLFENYLKIIKDEIARSQKITNSMLSFVRQKDRQKEELDLHDILDKTIEMLRFQEKLNGIEILRDYSQEIGKFHGYEGEIRQVFLTILNNAVEAMGEKGKLILETADLGNKVSIKITDTGPGVLPGHLERIFAPFFTTKSDQGGTGLGLFIAKKIIEENGGEIGVHSEVGRGTTFTITLPT